MVNELSRLTRKGAHDALEIDNEFKKYGVRFVSVLEPFLDTSNPVGVAIFALIAALAKQDSDIRAERLRGAKDEIRAVGGRHSGSAPYGMRAVREKIGALVVSVLEPDADNPDHVAIVERMADMSFAGARSLMKGGCPGGWRRSDFRSSQDLAPSWCLGEAPAYQRQLSARISSSKSTTFSNSVRERSAGASGHNW